MQCVNNEYLNAWFYKLLLNAEPLMKSKLLVRHLIETSPITPYLFVLF